MKIIHAVSTLDPAGGGPPHVAVRLAAAQAALGHEAHIVFYSTIADRQAVAQQFEGVPHRDRLGLHPVSDPGQTERIFGTKARASLHQVVRSSDFVHIHGIWGSMPRAAAEISMRHGVPYCIRPAGMLDPWSLAQKRLKKKLALHLVYRRLLDSASFIHALNEDEERLIRPLGLAAETVVIANGVFIEELVEPLPPPGRFRALHPDLGAAPFVLFLARLHHKKGLDILAQAFAEVARRRTDVHLVVAGPDEGAQPDFLERVAASGFASRVHVVGPLYGRAKFEAFLDASCFCLPSRQEGFSVAIVEAMACGVPVVISQACHFPEVEAAGAGVITSLDAEDVARGIESVLADRNAALRMGSAGAALVRARYTWVAIAEQTLATYRRRILAGWPRRATRPGSAT